ncbi:MAG: hypothetical protein WBE00_08325, partial [Phycisphaerae bacterium]
GTGAIMNANFFMRNPLRPRAQKVLAPVATFIRPFRADCHSGLNVSGKQRGYGRLNSLKTFSSVPSSNPAE